MSQEQKGLRVLTGLAGLFVVIAGAWYAQAHFIRTSQAEHEAAADLLGESATDFTEEGPREPAWGHVILGLPSGAAPLEKVEPQPDPSPIHRELVPEAELPKVPSEPRWPTDTELIVRPGQSLSKIAATSYGRATFDLVDRLARYNQLDDPNALRAGQTLRVPVKEKLLAQP